MRRMQRPLTLKWILAAYRSRLNSLAAHIDLGSDESFSQLVIDATEAQLEALTDFEIERLYEYFVWSEGPDLPHLKEKYGLSLEELYQLWEKRTVKKFVYLHTLERLLSLFSKEHTKVLENQ